MTRRSRTYPAAVGLATAFLAGCLGGPALRAPEEPSVPMEQPAAVTPSAPSSYHARVVDPPPPAAPAVEQVRFPVPPPAPQPVAAPVEAPRPPDAPLVRAARCVVDRRTSAAADVLQYCDPPSRELLLELLQLAAPLSEGGLEHASPRDAAALLERLNKLQAALRRRAPLVIEKMCFCREIRDFGKYYPLPPDYAFQTGSDGLPGELVQVYVEVRNVICRPRGTAYETAPTTFETALQGHVEIHDFRGKCVWQHDFDNKPDRSRTPLQDNYVAFHFNVPSELAADSAYTLWVYVKDVGEEGVVKVARRSLDFRVRPPRRQGSGVGDSASSP